MDGAVLATDLVGYSRLVVAGKHLGLNIRLPRHARRDVSEGAGLGRTPGFETDDLVVPIRRATLLIPAAGRHVREACGPQGQFELMDAPPAQLEQVQLGGRQDAVPPVFIAKVGQGGLGDVVGVHPAGGQGQKVAGVRRLGPDGLGAVQKAADGVEVEDQSTAWGEMIVKSSQHGGRRRRTGDQLKRTGWNDDRGKAGG